MDWNTLFAPVVIALVPILVALLKRVIPPSQGWLYPLLATGLGALLDTVSSYASGTSLGPKWGAVLGLAGVGLREIIDQLRQVVRIGPGLRILVPILLVPLLAGSGCVSGAKALIVSGEALNAAGQQFVQVAGLYNDMLDKGVITPEQYRPWKTFGGHFQFAFPKAVQLWTDARAAHDAEKERQAETLIRSLTTDLAVFATQVYQYLAKPPRRSGIWLQPARPA